jgi:hypothetical protein
MRCGDRDPSEELAMTTATVTPTPTATRWHAYPRTNPARRPTPWWYYGRALYVSRRDYFKIY